MREKSKDIYILSDTKIDGAKSLQLIKTQALEFTMDITQFDALVFTSKNGVKHLDTLCSNWKNIPAYAISDKTAQTIKEYGGNLAFVGEKKHGDQFAKELIEKLHGKKTAFIGAKSVVSNLVEILIQNDISCTHFPVYETLCMEYEEKVDLPENSIIIFSSPSTIDCFFKNVLWKESFQAISIGDTTAQYFPKDIQPIISEDRSLQSCVQKALSL